MGRINFQFKSKVLSQNISATVYIPDKVIQRGEVDKAKVIYLLHGKDGNHESWGMESHAFKYADEFSVILVMPYAANSFYTNMVYGDRYWDYIAEELPKVISNSFRISTSKKNTFVCGYSMGGYGALKLALCYPERYESAATLSGSLRSIEDTKFKIDYEDRPDLLYAFGDCSEKIKDESDIYYLTKKLLNEGRKLPKLYIYCGTRDSLYNVNCTYRDFALKNNIDIIFREDVGNHSFKYWDKELREFLQVINSPQ
jgi:S-formylglutathione hydrolase FrmB